MHDGLGFDSAPDFFANPILRSGARNFTYLLAFHPRAPSLSGIGPDPAPRPRCDYGECDEIMRWKHPCMSRLCVSRTLSVCPPGLSARRSRAPVGFPAAHRTSLHSTNPLERLHGEVRRRTDAVGIFPNADAIARPLGAILLERNDEWAVRRARYTTPEAIAPVGETEPERLPVVADR